MTRGQSCDYVGCDCKQETGMKLRRMIVLGLGAGFGLWAPMVLADLPREIVFMQKDSDPRAFGEPTYYGHAELSTVTGSGSTPSGAPPYQGRFMADDFATNSDTQVVHLRWWGSYMGAEHFKGSGGAFSKDLAFEVYTGALPEPGTMALAGIGIAMLSIRRRR